MRRFYNFLSQDIVQYISKIFNYIIMAVAIILLVVSILAFVSKQYELFSTSLSISSEGVSFYLKQFSKFYGLFGATITLIVAYYGIERLKAAERANYDKVKLDRYADWRLVTDIRIDLIKDENPLFRREFYKIRYQLFEVLYPDFSISDHAHLTLLFNKYFKNDIVSFENNNKNQQRMGGIYRSSTHHYFGEDLLFVFLGSLSGKNYDAVNEDFLQLYIDNLSSERLVNAETYLIVQERYFGREF